MKTGNERVARAVTVALLENPPAGYRVEPVYLDQMDCTWGYFRAKRRPDGMLGIEDTASDEIVRPARGDIVLGLDISGDLLVRASAEGFFDALRADDRELVERGRGVRSAASRRGEQSENERTSAQDERHGTLLPWVATGQCRHRAPPQNQFLITHARVAVFVPDFPGDLPRPSRLASISDSLATPGRGAPGTQVNASLRRRSLATDPRLRRMEPIPPLN